MIDLHSHILPGIDDGARDVNESIEMAKSYVAAGFKEVVATPHFLPGSSSVPSPSLIQERVQKLSRTLASENVDLTLWPGAEVGIDAAVPEMLDEGLVQFLGGSTYLLIEPPFQRLPNGWEKIIHAIQARGYNVIVAHPERCLQLMQTPDIIDDLISEGVYLQINWGSLLGIHGQEAEALAWVMLMKGCVHCLATDSHDARFRHAGLVYRAAEIVQEKIGRSSLDRLAEKNPARVLKSLPLETMDVSEIHRKPAKKRIWQIWK